MVQDFMLEMTTSASWIFFQAFFSDVLCYTRRASDARSGCDQSLNAEEKTDEEKHQQKTRIGKYFKTDWKTDCKSDCKDSASFLCLEQGIVCLSLRSSNHAEHKLRPKRDREREDFCRPPVSSSSLKCTDKKKSFASPTFIQSKCVSRIHEEFS